MRALRASMKTSHAERHIEALGLAKECAALGARSRTIEFVTGLSHGEVGRLFFSDRSSAPRGRAPASPEWYHSANLLNRVEASIFVSIYRRIRNLGFGPAEALVSGYKHYRQVCTAQLRISFDRAFDLASHMDGLWLVREPNFSLMTCVSCTSQYVASPSANAIADDCPFCKLIRRYRRDPRLQASFPMKPMPEIPRMPLAARAFATGVNASL
jgi:flagellar transcriptional activator FlhC